MRTVAAIGNVKDINTFSGTPYHFYKAAYRHSFVNEAWELKMGNHKFYRYLYGISQLVCLKKPVGYQYSSLFRTVSYHAIDKKFFEGEVISFNQHFPDAMKIKRSNGKIYYYIDATFKQLVERYEFSKYFGKKTIKKILEEEKLNFENADFIVTFQNWARESVVNEYKINSQKVKTILPGANLELPQNYFPILKKREENTKSGPFYLGFIGKDWERKGLLTVVEIKNMLRRRGWNVKIRCAGYLPDFLKSDNEIEYVGFIDKSKNLDVFCRFIESCNLGCLFSKAEFSSIAVLEFLRLGIPVAGYVVDGMNDLFFPAASLRFFPGDSLEFIASQVEELLINNNKYEALHSNAIKLSQYVTWDRCIEEWKQLLQLTHTDPEG